MPAINTPPAIIEYATTKDIRRQRLANKIFIFLRDHAVVNPDDKTQWATNDPYELHRSANEAQHDVPYKKIHDPDSVWERGGYKEYLNVYAHFQHDVLVIEMRQLIKTGRLPENP